MLKWKQCLFAVLCLLGSWSVFAVQSRAEETKRVKFCLPAPNGSAEFEGHRAVFGGLVTCAVYYRKLDEDKELEYASLKGDYDIILVLDTPQEFTKQGEIVGKLTAVMQGEYDESIKKLAARIKAFKKKITVRLLHEVNLKNSQGMFTPGNSPELYDLAFVHIAKLLRYGAGEYIAGIDLNYSHSSYRADERKVTLEQDMAQMGALKDVITSVSVSIYNRCNTAPFYIFRTFDQQFASSYRAGSAFGLPISIAEVSTGDYCGEDKVQWFREMADALEKKYPNVSGYINFFFAKVKKGAADNDRSLDWSPRTDDVPAFIRVWQKFLAKK